MFIMKNILLIIVLFILGCSQSNVDLLTTNINQVTLEEQPIVLNSDKNGISAESVDLGTVTTGVTNSKTITVSNQSGATLSLTFADLQSKISANTRFSIGSNSCSSTLKTGKVCSFIVNLSYVSSEVYNSITTNIVSGVSNSEYGKIVLSGAKQDPQVVVNKLNLFEIFKPSDLILNFSLSDTNTSVTKRLYFSNITQKNYEFPTINQPANAVISNNTCIGVIKLSKACFFDVTYSYTADPDFKSFNELISFTSSDAGIITDNQQINLNITNTLPEIKVGNLIFRQDTVQVNMMELKTTRLYIQNVGTSSINVSDLVAPEIYTIINTTCSSVLKATKNCYYDLSFNINNTANMLGASRIITVANTQGVIFSGNITSGAIEDKTNCQTGFSVINNKCFGECSMQNHYGITDLSHVLAITGTSPNCVVDSCSVNYEKSSDLKSCVIKQCKTTTDLLTNNPLILSTIGISSIYGDFSSGCNFLCDESSFYYKDLTGLKCNKIQSCSLSDAVSNGYNTQSAINVSGFVTNGDTSSCKPICNTGFTLSTTLNACVRNCDLADSELNGYNISGAINSIGQIIGSSIANCSISCDATLGLSLNTSAKQCDKQCSSSDAISNGVNTNNVASIVGIVVGTNKTACLINTCSSGYTKASDSKSCYFDARACTIADLVSNGYGNTHVSVVSGTVSSPSDYSACVISECESGYTLTNKSCVVKSLYSTTVDPIVGFANDPMKALDGTGLVYIKNGTSRDIDLKTSGLTYATSTKAVTLALKTNKYAFYTVGSVGKIGIDLVNQTILSDRAYSSSSIGMFPDTNTDYIWMTDVLSFDQTRAASNLNSKIYEYNPKTKVINKTRIMDSSTTTNFRMHKSYINANNNLMLISRNGYETIYDPDSDSYYPTTLSYNSNAYYYPFFYNNLLYLIAYTPGTSFNLYLIGSNSSTTLKTTITTGETGTNIKISLTGANIQGIVSTLGYAYSINLNTFAGVSVTIPTSSSIELFNNRIYAYGSNVLYYFNYTTNAFSTLKTFTSGYTINSMGADDSTAMLVRANGGTYTVSWIDLSTNTVTESGLSFPSVISFDTAKNNLFWFKKITYTGGWFYNTIGYVVNKTTNGLKSYTIENSSKIGAVSSIHYSIDENTAIGLLTSSSSGASGWKVTKLHVDTNTIDTLIDLSIDAISTTFTSITNYGYNTVSGLLSIPIGNQLLNLSDIDGQGTVASNTISATTLSNVFEFNNSTFVTGVIPDSNSNTVDRELLIYDSSTSALNIFLDLFNYDGNYRQYKYGFDVTNSNRLIESDRFFFGGQTVGSGVEPWMYKNGTASRLCDVNTGSETSTSSISSNPQYFVRVGTKIYFIGTTTSYGRQIYAYDENNPSNGCPMLTGTSQIPSSMTIYQGKALGTYILYNCGSVAGYKNPCFFNTLTNTMEFSYPNGTTKSSGASSRKYYIFNNKAYYYAYDASLNLSLYETNGTAASITSKASISSDMFTKITALGLTKTSAGYRDIAYATSDFFYFINNKTLYMINKTGSVVEANNPGDYIVSYIMGETTNNLYLWINNQYLGFVDKNDSTQTIQIIRDQNGDPIINGMPYNLIQNPTDY
jgi:hypothetical protein